MIKLELDVKQAASVRCALFQEQKDYTLDPTCCPQRVIDIRDIIVNIDKGEYFFYTTEDIPSTAWTEEDNKVIFAMKKGLSLVVTGQSSRGTVTNDTYTLKGFTASYNKLIENC